MPEPDCFLRYRISDATRNFTSGKSDVYLLVAVARRGFTMVSFTEAVSRRNTFVGGTCTQCPQHTPLPRSIMFSAFFLLLFPSYFLHPFPFPPLYRRQPTTLIQDLGEHCKLAAPAGQGGLSPAAEKRFLGEFSAIMKHLTTTIFLDF